MSRENGSDKDYRAARDLCQAKLRRCEALIVNSDPGFSLGAIPLDDPRVLAEFAWGRACPDIRGGRTAEGLGYILKTAKPSTLTEVSAVLALYRPGPLKSGILEDFADGASAKSRKPEHAALLPITGTTRGVLAFEEQITEAAKLLAGFNNRQAEALKKAIIKKDAKRIRELRAAFVAGVEKEGGPRQAAVPVFGLIEKQGRHAGSRARSYESAQFVYKMEYLKLHHPHEWERAEWLISTVHAVRDRLDIVDVVRRYVPSLRPAGRRKFKGACPLHKDKSTSFHVDGSKQLWQCFAEHRGGDLIAFIQAVEDLDLEAAARKLADLACAAEAEAV